MVIPILVGVVVGVFGIALFSKSKPGELVRGFLGLITEDIASTPKGAEASFLRAIEKKEEDYAKISDIFQDMSGRLVEARCDLEKKNKEIAEIEKKCESLAKLNRISDLQVMAKRREEILESIEELKDRVTDLIPKFESAKETMEMVEDQLNALKRKKESVVTDLTLSKQITKSINAVDEIRKDDSVDKLIAAAERGALEAKRRAAGAQIVHENRTSTKIARIDKSVREDQGNDYVNGLLEKYNNKN